MSFSPFSAAEGGGLNDAVSIDDSYTTTGHGPFLGSTVLVLSVLDQMCILREDSLCLCQELALPTISLH